MYQTGKQVVMSCGEHSREGRRGVDGGCGQNALTWCHLWGGDF